MNTESVREMRRRRDEVVERRREAVRQAAAKKRGSDVPVSADHDGAEVLEVIPSPLIGLSSTEELDSFIKVRIPKGFKAAVFYGPGEEANDLISVELLPVEADWEALDRGHERFVHPLCDDLPQCFGAAISDFVDGLSTCDKHGHSGGHDSSSSVGAAADASELTEGDPLPRRNDPKAVA